MSEILKWLDIAIAQLEKQLKAFRELRQKLIDSPEMDSSASKAADKLIKDSMPKD